MTAIASTESLVTLAAQATWQCTSMGFAHASVLSGTQAFVAVGTLARASSRAEIDAVLRDVALTEGYDAQAVLDLANAALALEELGSVDAIALFSAVCEQAEDLHPHVTGAGSPPPVAIAPDGEVLSATGGRRLERGSTVVLAAGGAPLRPEDVRRAIDHTDGAPAPRTLLRVLIG